MINATISAIEQAQLRSDIPKFRVGDTVRVHYKIVEGDKERVQVFQGVVIKRHRAGVRSTFTVRKVSANIGVERVFLEHSPRVDKIEILFRGVVRRARLFFLRELSGKAARLKDERDKLAIQRPCAPSREGPVLVDPGKPSALGAVATKSAASRGRRFTRQISTPMLPDDARRNPAPKTRLRGPLDDPMLALRCPEQPCRQVLHDLREPPLPCPGNTRWRWPCSRRSAGLRPSPG